jgi:Fic family protein
MRNKIETLPYDFDFETLPVLRLLVDASRLLAEVKGQAKTIPNEEILINTLVLQEAKDSSAVENIVTTHDEIFRAGIELSGDDPAAKEIQNYISALKYGYALMQETEAITTNAIIGIQEKLEKNRAGLRKVPGTTLKNSLGEIIYEPPQDHREIVELMNNLEKYLNEKDIQNIDPLIKMSIIHYQFESIHPFYDGNGRTGRIINLLYLVKEGLLDMPILYLSRYIIQNKTDYYYHLRNIRESNSEQLPSAWENWILFMLKAVIETSRNTIGLINSIKDLISEYSEIISLNSNFYSTELINTLFKNPYTKIAFLEEDLGIHRQTASTYLNELCDLKLLEKRKIGRSNYFINKKLLSILES